jgi:stearoyl-CoA desaturase (delta-9 desaturase)
LLKAVGLAQVKKVPPKLVLGAAQPVADEKTLEAIINNRYELMAAYARDVKTACKSEINALKAKGADFSFMSTAKKWLPRDAEKVPATALQHLEKARAAAPTLDKMIAMREELRQLWSSTHKSREQLVADLVAWCKRAEESQIAALQQFSLRLRMAQA